MIFISYCFSRCCKTASENAAYCWQLKR